MSAAFACVAAVPLAQLAVCSDSPWRTANDLPGVYLRKLQNEPANLPAAVLAVAAARGLVVGQGMEPSAAVVDLQASLRGNALRAFGLDRFSDEDAPPPLPVPSAHASAASGKPDGGASEGGEDAGAEDSEVEVEGEGQDPFDGGGGAIGGSEAAAAAGDAGAGEDGSTAVRLAELPLSPPSAGSVRSHCCCCCKCRAFLFLKGDVLQARGGGANADRILSKDGPREALCDAVLFLCHA